MTVHRCADAEGRAPLQTSPGGSGRRAGDRWSPRTALVPCPWTPTAAFVIADADATTCRSSTRGWRSTARARLQACCAIRSAGRAFRGTTPWRPTGAARRCTPISASRQTSATSSAKRCNATRPEPSPFALLAGSPSSTARDRRAAGRPTRTPWSRAAVRRAPQPYLFRRDYVTNSNDSYWLSNPHQPLEGFPRIIGDERTPRTLRTRIGLLLTQARVDGTDGLARPGSPDGTCSTSCSATAVRRRADPRRAGGDVPRAAGRPGPRRPRCAASPSATPATSWRAGTCARTWTRAAPSCSGASGTTSMSATSPTPGGRVRSTSPTPSTRPNTLDATHPGVPVALGQRRSTDLQAAGVPLDVGSATSSTSIANGMRIPIHGGPGDPHGQFNAI